MQLLVSVQTTSTTEDYHYALVRAVAWGLFPVPHFQIFGRDQWESCRVGAQVLTRLSGLTPPPASGPSAGGQGCCIPAGLQQEADALKQPQLVASEVAGGQVVQDPELTKQGGDTSSSPITAGPLIFQSKAKLFLSSVL